MLVNYNKINYYKTNKIKKTTLSKNIDALVLVLVKLLSPSRIQTL